MLDGLTERDRFDSDRRTYVITADGRSGVGVTSHWMHALEVSAARTGPRASRPRAEACRGPSVTA